METMRKKMNNYDVTHLINQATQCVEPGAIRHVLSTPADIKQGKCKAKRTTNLHEVVYHSSSGRQSASKNCLWLITEPTEVLPNTMSVSLQQQFGMSIVTINNFKIFRFMMAGGVCFSDKGKIPFVMHQYAYNPAHQTIHSSMKMEHFGLDDCSIVFGGSQHSAQLMTTFCLSVFRIDCNILLSDLSRILMGESAHIILTSDADWDPDVDDQDAPFTFITSAETNEPQVNIEAHTT